LALDWRALSEADSLESFVESVPIAVAQAALSEATEAYEQEPRPIILEAALDHAYFEELLKRTRALPRAARGHALPIAQQEADTFHLMLVARARFSYGLAVEQLAGLHVPGTCISHRRFEHMLAADTLRRAAQQGVGLVVSGLPAEGAWQESGSEQLDAAVLDALAWNRYHQLARRAFRRSHMGLGAVVAFAALRRVEVANLITLSEAIRVDLPADIVRARLIPSATETHRV
jgi:vacuolar-type H+-ATPase subunit C/Vma6